jgi:hypothetical protein
MLNHGALSRRSGCDRAGPRVGGGLNRDPRHRQLPIPMTLGPRAGDQRCSGQRTLQPMVPVSLPSAATPDEFLIAVDGGAVGSLLRRPRASGRRRAGAPAWRQQNDLPLTVMELWPVPRDGGRGVPWPMPRSRSAARPARRRRADDRVRGGRSRSPGREFDPSGRRGTIRRLRTLPRDDIGPGWDRGGLLGALRLAGCPRRRRSIPDRSCVSRAS